MITRLFAVAGTVAVLVGSATAPAAADDEQSWETPDLDGMSLETASDTLRTLTGNDELEIHTEDVAGLNRQQLAPRMWKVCWQAPQAGEPLTDDSWVGFGVTRMGVACW